MAIAVVIAVMTDRLLATSMVRERNLALGTLAGLSAGRALDVGGETAAVEQQNHLSIIFECLLHGPVQLAADCPAGVPILLMGPQIHSRHTR